MRGYEKIGLVIKKNTKNENLNHLRVLEITTKYKKKIDLKK